jgi:hypothetical protein
MQRLSNDELAERQRATNRRRSERQRARRVESGKTALTVWVRVELHKQILEQAAAESSTTSIVAERLLDAALNPPAGPPEASTPAPVTKAAPDNAERDALILALHAEGKSLSQIALVLAERGILTSKGNPLSKSTINRVVLETHRLNPEPA